MRLRLDTEDDLLHAPTSDTNFNESRYYNFFDRSSGLGGWMRMGNRPNEGYAEMTVCLYLPDGRVAFMFRRPKIDSHIAHDSGGLRFDVVAPFVEHRVAYEGNSACSPNRARWPTRAPHSPATRTKPPPSTSGSRPSRCPTAASRCGTKARSRHLQRRRFRHRPHRAAHGDHRRRPDRRPSVRHHRRRGPARSLVGAAGLAEHLVVPVGHRQLRPLGIACTVRGEDGRRPPRQGPRLRRRPLRRHPAGSRSATPS